MCVCVCVCVCACVRVLVCVCVCERGYFHYEREGWKMMMHGLQSLIYSIFVGGNYCWKMKTFISPPTPFIVLYETMLAHVWVLPT